MNFLDGLPTTGIIIIIAVAAVLLVVLFIVLWVFVISRNMIKKRIKDLERKYSYLDALLIGQDSQYVKRLEIISRTNLLYTSIYTNYSKKFKDVYEVDDKFAEGSLNQLRKLVASNQYKNIKKVIEETKKAIENFETNTMALDAELSKLIKPEEDARVSILKLKESYRIVKQNYISASTDLIFVSDSFEKVFKKLEDKFDEFEEHVESAEYDDASAMIPVISKVINELSKVLTTLPILSALVTKTLPDKIENLKKEEESMVNQGYPLYHLLTSKTYEDFEHHLEDMKERLKNLSIDGIEEECKEIQEHIENIHLLFEKETQSKSYFLSNSESIYHSVTEIEKTFLRLCSVIPEMNRVYKITEEETERIENLKATINKLTNSKRMLDTYVHSATKQPYSILSSKLEDLSRDLALATEGVNNFKNFLDSLKNTTEEAYTLVFSYYYQTKNLESSILSISIDSTYEKYKESFEQIYALLNEIDTLVKAAPIDVHITASKVEELKTLAENVFASARKDYNDSQISESSIIYANRDRFRQMDFHKTLKAYENHFFNGEFSLVYNEVCELLRKLKLVNENTNNKS